MIEQYKDSLLSLISTLVGGCETYQALLRNGKLIIIVNNGIVYAINVADMFPQDLRMTIYYRNTTKGSIYNIGYDHDLEDQIMRRIDYISISPYDQPVYFNDDFSQNETFQEMRNGKNTDGQFKFILDSNRSFRIIVILFKGVFNMAKADKISLTIYDKSYMNNALEGSYLVFDFGIYKKKINKNYNIRFMILNLWRDRRNYGITTE